VEGRSIDSVQIASDDFQRDRRDRRRTFAPPGIRRDVGGARLPHSASQDRNCQPKRWSQYFQPKSRTMSNINSNCDGSHCRHGYKEVRKYPSSDGDELYLCLPCFANGNMHRHNCAKKTGRSEEWPQVSWSTAEVVYDKHGEQFDAQAAVRQGIVNYHQNGDDNE
jgi:hypothetical protein